MHRHPAKADRDRYIKPNQGIGREALPRVCHIRIFLQKVAATGLVQLKMDPHAAFRQDIRASLDHSECKMSEFLRHGYRIDLLDKHNKCTFTLVMATASVSFLFSWRATLRNRSLASSGLMSETWKDCGA